MVRVVMMEQVRLGEWNEKSRKENGQDEVDGMKQEVDSKDRVYRKRVIVILRKEDEEGRVMSGISLLRKSKNYKTNLKHSVQKYNHYLLKRR